MRNLIYVLVAALFIVACNSKEEGLIGEWEGTTELLNSDGELVESDILCTITKSGDLSRDVIIEVAGVSYAFEAMEAYDVLTYKDKALQNDTLEKRYISGSAELHYDTLLHFEHEIYALKNGALLYSDKMVYDMVRK